MNSLTQHIFQKFSIPILIPWLQYQFLNNTIFLFQFYKILFNIKKITLYITVQIFHFIFQLLGIFYSFITKNINLFTNYQLVCVIYMGYMGPSLSHRTNYSNINFSKQISHV